MNKLDYFANVVREAEEMGSQISGVSMTAVGAAGVSTIALVPAGVSGAWSVDDFQHVTRSLAKAGDGPERIRGLLEPLSAIGAFQFPAKDFQGQIKRSIELFDRKGSVEEQLREIFLSNPNSEYGPSELASIVGADKGNVSRLLTRMRDNDRFLVGEGRKYKLAPPDRRMNPWEVAANEFELSLPFNIHDWAVISQGDLVVVAGQKNTGKTGFLLQTALDNIDKPVPIRYISTENNRKIGRRLTGWGHGEELNEKIEFFDCRNRVYEGAILPDAINILDYFNPPMGEYGKTAHFIEDMAKHLNNGVLVLGIQMTRGDSPTIRGKEQSQELSQLTVVLEDLKIVGEGTDKTKLARAKMVNIKEPRGGVIGEGRRLEYEVDGKGRLTPLGYWEWSGKA